MNERMLVATDGSDHALRAVDMAARMAACFEADLAILTVLMRDGEIEEASRLNEVEHLVPHVSRAALPRLDNVPGSMKELFGASQTAQETARIVTVLGERIAESAATRAREAGAAKVHTRVVGGEYADKILEVAEEIGADMIIVGSRGLGRLKGLLVGSVSHKVVQYAKCSVMTVR